MPRNKSWFFRNNPLLALLADGDIDTVEQQSETLELRKKSAIWMPGDPADRLFLVRSGIAKISKVTEEGRELTLQFHTKDDMFGEVAVFSDGPHDTLAEAYEDATIYAIPREVFVAAMRAEPRLALAVTELISERRRRLENRIGGLLFKTAHARLAALFMDLTEDFGVRDSRGVIVNLKLTHKEMGALIGATRETVSFAILDLRRDGLIQTEGKRVIILDEEALTALVNT